MIVLHDHNSHCLLCCALIGVEGIKVYLQPIRDCEVKANSAPGCRNNVSSGIYFKVPPWENFAYCDPVGEVGMWVYHRYLVLSFANSSISEWTLDMNTSENMRKAEEDSPKHIFELYKHSTRDIDAMVLDATNPEEVGKEDGLKGYDKLWGDLDFQISITMH